MPSTDPQGVQANVNGIDPKLTIPKTLIFQLATEKQLGKNLIVGINYSGSEGYGLISGNRDYNRFAGDLIQNAGRLTRLNPNFGSMGFVWNKNSSNYNAMILTARQHLNSGFDWQASYTYSHALDYGMHKNVELVKTLRETLGEDYEIMFDAFSGWDQDYALEWAKRVEQYRPRWMEEVTHPEKIDSFAAIRRGTSVPLASGEHFYGRWEVERYLQAATVSIVQADPEWCGGLSELLKIGTVASLHDVSVIPIDKAEDYERFVARDGEDIERNPGRVVLVAACIEIEEDAGRDGRHLGSEPDDLVVHDLEISIQERLIEPSLIHEGGVSSHHVLDGHHSGKLRLVPVVDAGFDALLVHGLGTDGSFH
jgi:hypothetical protein